MALNTTAYQALQTAAVPTRTDAPLIVKQLGQEVRDYRSFVGNSDDYDIQAAMQFIAMAELGMREHHTLLDIGCGSLRPGRLFIPYLKPGNYFGIEPEQWLLDEAFDREIGRDVLAIKRPHFLLDSDFRMDKFNQQFDYLLCQSIFSHASQQQIRQCLKQVAGVMHENSVFVPTFIDRPEIYSGTEWVYPGITTYPLDFMVGMVEEAGLKCVKFDWYFDTFQTWLLVFKPGFEEKAANMLARSPLFRGQSDLQPRFHNLLAKYEPLVAREKLLSRKCTELEADLQTSKENLSLLLSHPLVKMALAVRRMFKA